MKKVLLLAFFCFNSLLAFSQDSDIVFTILEQPSHPQGGMQAFYKYISDSIQYPVQAKRMKIEGKVFVSFIVEKDGSLTNIKIIRGIGAGCDEEAIRLIQQAEKWIPGAQRGRPVRQIMTMPITFKLDSGKSKSVSEKEKPEIIEDPEFPRDNLVKFYKYVGENIKYPKKAKRMGIDGKVFVRFVIEKDGSSTDIKVVRGIGGGCDEEAVRIIREYNKWTPSTQDGKPVRQEMTLPITFILTKK